MFVEMIACANLSLSIGEHPQVAAFLKALNPRFVIPSATKITKSLLPNAVRNIENQMKNKLFLTYINSISLNSRAFSQK
mgnify:CR=1 FL=1